MTIKENVKYLTNVNLAIDKIAELEKENKELKAQIEQLSNDNHVLKTSFIIQQEQIEKMKCCKMTESQMHKLASKPITIDCFEMDDFEDEIEYEEGINDDYFHYPIKDTWGYLISVCEYLRQKYNETKDKRYWKELIRLLPNSYHWELAK